MVEKEVFSSTDEFIVSQICTVFKEKDIPFVRKDGGAVSYLSIEYGQDMLSQKKKFKKYWHKQCKIQAILNQQVNQT